jgi:hypothetical protein
VHQDYSPARTGWLSLNYSADPVSSANVIKPLAEEDAYVTFGTGVSSQELNDALHKSGLFTMGAAYGEICCPPDQTTIDCYRSDQGRWRIRSRGRTR